MNGKEILSLIEFLLGSAHRATVLYQKLQSEPRDLTPAELQELFNMRDKVDQKFILLLEKLRQTTKEGE